MEKITRRDFLKGSVAGAASLAAASVFGTAAAPVAAFADEAPAAAAAPASLVPSWTELNPQDESYDTYTTDFAELFSPIQVGPMKLRNRIIKSAAGSDTMPRGSKEMSQNALDYYGRIADGGTALVVLEEGTCSAFGLSVFFPMSVETPEQGRVEAQKLADRVHAGGALIGSQLGIGMPGDTTDVTDYTIDQLKGFVKSFGETALRMKEAGFDCVEVKGATTDNLNKFLSREKNKREDEYGAQTEENRVRLFREIIEEIRAKCGEDFGILTLINAVEENDQDLGANEGFILIEEAQNLAKVLEKAGANLVQIRVGAKLQEANCWAPDTMFAAYKANGTTGMGAQFDFNSHWQGLMDGTHSGVGAFIPLAAKIKEVVDIPVGCAAVMDPRLAPDLINNAIKDGKIDLVFINRALTVDPQLPKKLQEGRRDEIAPCTHCFHCHGAPYGEPECCRVNATTQFAYTEQMPDGYELVPTDSPKKVLVIGGGAAGMEAARVAAIRGHEVTLYEKNGYMGGMLNYAELIKGPHERLGDLRAYLTRQLELNNVKVVTGAEVSVDTVKSENPDAVIVAVGGGRESRFSSANLISMDEFPGAKIGENVVILGANLQATDIAQYLIAQGKKVTLINEGPENTVDSEQSYWVRKYIKAHLYAHGVKIWNEASVSAVSDSGVSFTLPSGIEKTIPADTVIECWNMVGNTALADEIKAAGYDVIAAGCDAPKNIQAAIHAGHMAARYL